jgi:hypothetical protein
MTLPLIEFSFDDQDNLVMTPTPEGIAEAQKYLAKGDTSDWAFLNLIEWYLGNGWDQIAPEEIRALTSALIISRDGERDENGELIDPGRMWSNIEFYQIRSEIGEFAAGRPVTWKLVQ